MEKPLLNPSRGRGEKEIPGTGIILVNPTDAVPIINQYAKKNSTRRPLFNSNLLLKAANGSPGFIAGPTVGAPMAVLTLEKLIALGATRVVVYGWAGAITDSIACEDLILPTWSVSTEGTSRHYPISEERPKASAGLAALLLKALATKGTVIHQGPIWTTDAPYRETATQVRDFATRGILAVEMEFAALATVAHFRGIDLAAAFLVSDNLARNPYQSKIMRKSFHRQSKKIAVTIITAMTEGKI